MLATTLGLRPLSRPGADRADPFRRRRGSTCRSSRWRRDGRVIEQARLTKLLAFRGLDRLPIEEAQAGDIIAVAGLALTTVADTICAPEVDEPLPADPIDPPTLAMTFSVNDSPLAGREGTKVTSRMIGERLLPRGRGQCRDPRRAERAARRVRGRRPRRIAARRPDRDDAARRLRAVDLAPAGAVQDRPQPASGWSRSRRSSSTSTRNSPASSSTS